MSLIAQKIQYTPKYKPNQLICGVGQTAVITGWSTRQSIAKKLSPEQYAVIGQLYSPTRGINFLVRNLLYNPHVTHLVAVNATKEDRNAGAIDCLLDFFKNGFKEGVSDTGRQCWVICSHIAGYIDIDIPAQSLTLLRQSIRCYEAKTAAAVIEIINTLCIDLPPWSIPQTFPLEILEPAILPGTRYGHRVEGKTIAETWVKIIHRIKTTGTIRPTGYDGQWQELIDLVAIVVDEPEAFYFPEPNYLPVDKSFIDEYIPQVLDDAPYREGVKYTYGQRLRSWFGRDQIKEVVSKLTREIDAASAVMNLWDSGNNIRRNDGSSDHQHGGSPCLNHIWVRVVDNELSLTATFRSNDMFSAWTSNAMGLRALQRHIKDEVEARSSNKLVLGPLITISQSAHIYDDCWENADRLIANQYAQIVNKQSYFDPCGDFLIEVEDSQIVVSQTIPNGGEVVKKFAGKHPLKLLREICASSPGIQPDHAAYLGLEIQKAFMQGDSYVQDR